MQVAEARAMPERQHRVYWWKEALIVVAFYLLYSWTRNQFGSNAVEPRRASRCTPSTTPSG